MKKNRTQPSTPGAPAKPGVTEYQVDLSDIETELVRAAVDENVGAQRAADGALAARLAPIRAHHNLKDGTRADFRPSKDGKRMVMVVFEEKAS
jgi:hypothetical protein